MVNALDTAASQGEKISVLAQADHEMPPNGSKTLDHPALQAYFATNPSQEHRQHPKLAGLALGQFTSFLWELILCFSNNFTREISMPRLCSISRRRHAGLSLLGDKIS